MRKGEKYRENSGNLKKLWEITRQVGGKMGIHEIQQAAKQQEWQERICECRNSGQPVRRWCTEHGISVQTYYRWEKRCITQATGMPESSASAISLVRVEAESLPTAPPLYPCLPAVPEAKSVTIRMGEVSIELPAGTEAEQIARLVRALNHA